MLNRDRQPTREKLPHWLVETRSLRELKDYLHRPDVHAAFFIPQVPSFVKFPDTYRPMVDSYRSVVNRETDAYIMDFVQNTNGLFSDEYKIGGEHVRFDGPWNEYITQSNLLRHQDSDDENTTIRLIRAFGRATEYAESEAGSSIILPENAICAHTYKVQNGDSKEFLSPWHNKPMPKKSEPVRVSVVMDFVRKRER